MLRMKLSLKMKLWSCQSMFLPTIISSAVSLIVKKSGANVHGPQRMNPTDVGDPLTLPVVPRLC